VRTPGRAGIERRAFVEAIGVLEERREELPLIGRGAEREAPLPCGDVAPRRADVFPERLGALGVAARAESSNPSTRS
jgi:hypothetical protein